MDPRKKLSKLAAKRPAEEGGRQFVDRVELLFQHIARAQPQTLQTTQKLGGERSGKHNFSLSLAYPPVTLPPLFPTHSLWTVKPSAALAPILALHK